MLKFEKFLIVCVLLIFTTANSYGQSIKVSVAQSNKTLGVFMSSVESQTGYTFMHNNTIDRNTIVSVEAKDELLPDLLKRVFAPLDITFEISNTHIVLNKRTTNSEKIKISGTVTDTKGNPIVGATIVIVGTQVGTTTNTDGKYTISANISKDIIRITYLGYKTIQESINNRKTINVKLDEQINSLDEVIVVGYGTQKRRDVVGAIEQVSGEILEGRANPNVVRTLQGAIPGVNVSLWDGKPSRATTPTIRGIQNSIGAGGSALVLIDGVEGNLAQINPADVESISVLKDASSAAVYGARGAFGVILITTKKAKKNEVTVSYSGNVSVKRRTAIPDLVTDGLEWTNMYLESWQTYNNTTAYPTSIDVAFPFSASWYENMKKHAADPSLEPITIGSDGLYKYYGNTSWYDMFYKDHNMSTEHSMSVSGGTDLANFYISGRFFDQDGIYKVGNENFRQYNIRAKGQVQITPWLTLDNNFSITRRNDHQPMIMYGNLLVPRQISRQGYPITMVTNPDGTWTDAAVYTGYAGFAEGTSWQKDMSYDMKNTVALTATPIKNIFKIKADFTYGYNRNKMERLNNQYTAQTGPNTSVTRSSYSMYSDTDYDTDYLASNITGDFTPDLGDNHNLSLMAGWNIEEKVYKTQNTLRRGVLYPDRPSFTLMDGDYYETGSGGHTWGFVGFFARLNYNYKSRYLVEVSGRYDGTSKFPTDQQWGLFPSASAGWRISEENFMKNTKGWLDNLKVRASVGSLGNGLVDPYQYLSLMSIAKTTYLFSGLPSSYTKAPGLVPDGLTWEKATTYDIGLDVDMFSNRLTLVADYYQKYTSDMYTVGPTLPAVLGSAAPKGNYAELKTNGWELSLGWRDSFKLGGKPFSYNAKVMVWDSRSWITKFYNNTGSINTYYKGQELGNIWGFQIEGLFRDQADIDSHADQSLFAISNKDGVLLPGDLKFKDVDHNGIINRGTQTLSDHGDLTVIGNTSPRYNYGINLGANWNGIGISLFLQGVGKRDWYPAKESALFWGQYGRSYESALKLHSGNNRYTDENKNVNAYWPRYRGYQAQRDPAPMSVASDRFLQNVSYLRLKNITVEYSLPKSITDKLRMKQVKVYFSGENLFTFSKLFKVTKNFDPEVINSGDQDWQHTSGSDSAGDGYGYPMLKSITFGINITF